MKRFLVLLIIILSPALVGPVLAQLDPGGGAGREPGGGPTPTMRHGMARGHIAGATSMLMRLYDPKTVTTVKGAVESLETTRPMLRAAAETIRYVVLKMEAGTIKVYLAPDWYLDQEKVSLKVGDKLEVTGSKVTINKQPAIIANGLKVRGKTVTLRNEKGIPGWLGQETLPGSPAQ